MKKLFGLPGANEIDIVLLNNDGEWERRVYTHYSCTREKASIVWNNGEVWQYEYPIGHLRYTHPGISGFIGGINSCSNKGVLNATRAPDIIVVARFDPKGNRQNIPMLIYYPYDKNQPVAYDSFQPLSKLRLIVSQRDPQRASLHMGELLCIGDILPLPQLQANDIPRRGPTPSDVDIINSTAREAAEKLTSACPGLEPLELQIGLMHMKGTPWDDIVKKCHRSKGVVSKYLNRFYRKTGLPRCDRRLGMGKHVRFDENRDSCMPGQISKPKSTNTPEHY